MRRMVGFKADPDVLEWWDRQVLKNKAGLLNKIIRDYIETHPEDSFENLLEKAEEEIGGITDTESRIAILENQIITMAQSLDHKFAVHAPTSNYAAQFKKKRKLHVGLQASKSV